MLVLQPNTQPRRGTLCVNREVGQAVIIQIGGEVVRVTIGKRTQVSGTNGKKVAQLVISASLAVSIVREEIAGL
jgi:hypothetical protein